MSEAEAVFVFDPPPGLWTGATSTNLRFVCGMAIGTDHFRSAQSPLPEGVVVGRLLDPLAPQRMGHYVVHAVLGLALGAPEFARQQAAGQWEPTATSVPKDAQV
jgi:phosphoglycerate dehydrogenase-like enzyme